MGGTRSAGLRMNPPYLVGAYLAVNAVPDLYLLVDGPDCAFSKAEKIHGQHDLFSTLLSCEGDHRVRYTGVNVDQVAADFEGRIEEGLRRMAAGKRCAAVALTSLPMCTIVGTDYARLLRRAGGAKPMLLLPGKTLSDDWLGGYEAVLDVMAAGMDLKGGRRKRDTVAVVGHLMDRNEGDLRGSAAELRRMLKALELRAATIWLSGEPWARLREVRNAGTIISLPYGRKAARRLAKRLKARLVETDLPFGVEGSRRWVEKIGKALGREERARAFVRRELEETIPRLEWIVPRAFLGRRIVFAGDPHRAGLFKEQVEGLGAEVPLMLLTGERKHLPASWKVPGCRSLFEPKDHEVRAAWEGVLKRGVDLLVTNTEVLDLLRPRVPWVEWGYPSHYTHFPADEPFLGFRGALTFLGRLANAVSRGAANTASRMGEG